jgi:GntR family transcriptional regulator / MocR family aminotransferase
MMRTKAPSGCHVDVLTNAWRSAVQLSLTLDPASSVTLHSQIFEQVRDLIRGGLLTAGGTLPPSRLLSEAYGISRNTVTSAYDRLVSEGYAHPRGTAGLFVCEILPDEATQTAHTFTAQSGAPTHGKSAQPVLCFAGIPGDGSGAPAIDFWVGRPDPAEFPIKVWRRLINRRLAQAQTMLTDYSDPAGLSECREAIAEHLARDRGMHVSANQIIITNGGQDALNLLCRLLARPATRLCIENPCYLGASILFQEFEKEICPVAVDDAGLKVEDLPEDSGNLLYVTPSHQFPTGATLSLKRRLALLQWAEQTESLIIEDDQNSDFRYDGPPLATLASLDRSRHVFYVGSFSKSVGAGLRLGFAVVPKPYWDRARTLKAQMSNGQSWLDQAALADFLRERHFERHLRRLRQVYKSRRDCLVKTLNEQFAGAAISGLSCGLHLTWRLPHASPPASDLQEKARANGIGIYTLKSGAIYDFDAGPRDDVVVMGYAAVPETSIVRAVETLKRLVTEARTHPGVS